MRRHETAADRFGRVPSIAVSRCMAVIETVAFWGAIAAPLGYLPALVFGGDSVLLATLISINLACLIVGHRHSPSFDAGVVARVMPAAIDSEGEQ